MENPFDQFDAPKQPNPFDRFDAAPSRPATPHDMGWGDVAMSAVKNIPSSAWNMAGDIGHAIAHPIDTAGTMLRAGEGAVLKALPDSWVPRRDEHPSIQTANAIGDFFIQRYGSEEGIKKAIAEDPVGVLGDLSTVFTGGGAAAARAPGIAGRVGKMASAAGAAIDPVAQAARGIGAGAGMAGRGVAEVIGNLGTHTGARSLTDAFSAGQEGGQVGADFQSALRGQSDMAGIVDDARSGLQNMRTERGAEYRQGMAAIGQDQTVLNFRPIDDALRDISGIGVYKGQTIAPSTEPVFQKIAEAVDTWRNLDPVQFHTPEGMDALKRMIGDIRDSTEPRTPSRVMADKVYNAIKGQVVAQAPEYAKVMGDYSSASDLITEIEKALSLGDKAALDTTIRKLQSVTRNNANTNYGHRVTLAEQLEAAGAENLMAKLAGQSLSSWSPRGLGKIVAGGTGVAGISNPAMLAAIPFMSPRAMGEAAYYGGKGYEAAAPSARIAGKALETAGLEASQLGRMDEQTKRSLARLLMNGGR
jgi:hypothetical protein